MLGLNSKLSLVFSLAFLTTTIVFADKADKFADIARKAKGKTTVVCGPKGNKDGALEISDAIKKLTPNSVLKILPGKYSAELFEIDVLGLIIEGAVPTEKCDLSIIIKGNNCVVRKINLKEIIAFRNLTIIDSIIDSPILRHDWKNKATQVMYNSCAKKVFVDCSGKKIYIKKCTFAHDIKGLELSIMINPHTGKQTTGFMEIVESVICGKSAAFYWHSDMHTKKKMDKLNLVFNKNQFFGEDGVFSYSPNDKFFKKLKSMKGFLKCKMKERGNIIDKKPEFTTEDGFALNPTTPAGKKGWGAKLDKKTGFPSKK